MEIKTEIVLEFKNHRIHLTTGELKQLRDFIDRQIAYLSPSIYIEMKSGDRDDAFNKLLN